MKSRPSDRKNAFGKHLKEIRLKRGLSLEELAERANNIPKSSISNYERGTQSPRHATAYHLAHALGLEGSQRDDFFRVLGEPQAFKWVSLLDKLRLEFNRHTNTAEDKARLARRLENSLTSWQESKRSVVRWAVIPVAGWLGALFSPETIAGLVRRAVKEAQAAGLRRYVTVVEAHHRKALSALLQDLIRKNRVQVVVQEKPGLGSLLSQLSGILRRNEAFAFIVPGDSVKPSCLGSMIEVYNKEKAPVVALRHPNQLLELESRSSLQARKCVTFKERVGSACVISEVIDSYSGSQSEMAIIGRLIFTSDMVHALASEPMKLADVLEQGLANGIVVHGYIYEDKDGMLSLFPYREALEEHLKLFLES